MVGVAQVTYGLRQTKVPVRNCRFDGFMIYEPLNILGNDAESVSENFSEWCFGTVPKMGEQCLDKFPKRGNRACFNKHEG